MAHSMISYLFHVRCVGPHRLGRRCWHSTNPNQDGKPELVQAASVSIHGPHGQYIENIHLEKYTSTEEFFDTLYEGSYKKLLMKAEQFVKETNGSNDDTLVIIRYASGLLGISPGLTVGPSVVDLMLVNTSMSLCQDTDVQSRWNFIIGLRGMRVHLRTG